MNSQFPDFVGLQSRCLSSYRQPSFVELRQLNSIAYESISEAEIKGYSRQQFQGFTIEAEVAMRSPGVNAIRCSVRSDDSVIETSLFFMGHHEPLRVDAFVEFIGTNDDDAVANTNSSFENVLHQIIVGIESIPFDLCDSKSVVARHVGGDDDE